ncbi:MAG: class I SAM-dependent methyltransferase [Clostridia bacterium]|nr:class I SAM-dependent methyltransferase [Clostridia bacterium]
MTTFYDLFMAPLEKRWLTDIRKTIIPSASGKVLEIGFGTGVNLQYLDCDQIDSVTALDLDFRKTNDKCDKDNITFVKGKAEQLPFPDASFDTVIETLVLCSVSDLETALQEIMRVLKPKGRFIYIDHVLPDDKALATLFKGINHFWPHIASGCNVTRTPHLSIARHEIEHIESGHRAHTIFRYGIVTKH